MKGFIAVDGGGTKTEVLLVDVSGTIHNRAIVDCTNPNDVTMDKSFLTLKNELVKMMKVAKKKKLELAGIYLLIAGIEFGDSKQILKDRLTKALKFSNIEIDGDLASVKEAGLYKDNDGVVIISGTGFNMAIKSEGKFFGVGGWGHLADNYLCGFTLGKEALNASSRAINGVGNQTILVDLLEKKLGKSLWFSMAEIYEGGVKKVASFAPLVIEAYNQKDPVSVRIVDDRINSLINDIKVSTKDVKKPLKVCLFGGIFEHNAFIRERLSNGLGKEYKIEIIDKKPIYGVVYFAMKHLGELNDEFTIKFDKSYKE